MAILDHFSRSLNSCIARFTPSRHSESSGIMDHHILQISMEAGSCTKAKEDTEKAFELPAGDNVSLGRSICRNMTTEEGNYPPQFKIRTKLKHV